MKTGDLLTVTQTAQRLGLKESTIRKMIAQRRIAIVRPSIRAVRIPEMVVMEILQKGYSPAIGETE